MYSPLLFRSKDGPCSWWQVLSMVLLVFLLHTSSRRAEIEPRHEPTTKTASSTNSKAWLTLPMIMATRFVA